MQLQVRREPCGAVVLPQATTVTRCRMIQGGAKGYSSRFSR